MDVKFRLPSLPPIPAPRPVAAPEAGGASGVAAPSATTGRADSPFSNVLDQALTSVSKVQDDAGRLQQRFQSGAADASLEETMVSMQKAQLAFASAVTVRNRLVSAYTDIMNMNV
jgi:flagellar hook-basal body complex protein FliE